MDKDKISGVYRIHCVSTGRSYIGSSVNVSNRYSWHKSVLTQNSPSHLINYWHPCQDDWLDYGKDSFVFELLEQCTEELLLTKEQEWLDKQVNPYNISKANGSRINSPETKQAMSTSAQARCTPKWREDVSKRVKEQYASGKFGPNTRIKKYSDKCLSCDNVSLIKGYCGMHYQRVRRWGDPNISSESEYLRVKNGEGKPRSSYNGVI